MIRRRFISLVLASQLLTSLQLITPVLLPSAKAATVTATGTNPSVCNQEVGSATNVVAYRLSGGDCVIEFKNVGTTTWTVSNGVTSVSVLVVGGGGGGASRHGGGGGAGGVVYSSSYAVSGVIAVQVGTGGTGAGAAVARGGTSGNDSRFYDSGETSSGATGLVAKGGGFGDFYTMVSNNIVRAGSGGSGGGSGVPNPFTRDLSSGYTNANPIGLTIQASQTQKNLDGTTVSSSLNQYGNNGAEGGNTATGSGNTWTGGGGGGAGAAGSRGGGVNGTSNYNGGAGGVGIAISITGTSTFYGGGGGGGGGTNLSSNFAGGAGGNGGGGAGSTGTATATSGTANTGGGGGGGGLATTGAQGAGGNGGSGIVIVRYTPVYTVSYDSNGGSAPSPSSSSWRYGTSLTLPAAPTKFGYTFNGWWTGLGVGSSRVGMGGGIYTPSNDADFTLYGYWTSTLALATPGSGLSGTFNTPYSLALSSSGGSGGNSYSRIAGTLPSGLTLDAATGVISGTPTQVGLFANLFIRVTDTSTATATNGSSFTITINKATQALTFSITSYAKRYGDTQTVTATSAGSGAITYSSGSSTACSVDASTGVVSITASSGTCTISASRATDSNYESANSSNSVSITVSTAISSATLTFTTGTNLIFNRSSTLSAATNSVAGKVHFKVNGKTIPGCKSRPANAGNTYTATCNYKPATRSPVSVTAILTPTSNLYGSSTVSSATYQVSKRG